MVGRKRREGERDSSCSANRPGNLGCSAWLVSFCRCKTKQDFRLNFKSLPNSLSSVSEHQCVQVQVTTGPRCASWRMND